MKAALALTFACALTACACRGKAKGPGPGKVVDPAACDGLVDKVRGLYQALPGLGADELADDVALVLRECKAAPAKVVPCLERATAVADLERSCLPTLDDEGSEGKVFLDR